MENKEAIADLMLAQADVSYRPKDDSIDMAIKALEQEPCEDAVSRVKVLEQINCWIGSGEYKYTNATWYLNKRIKDLSSIQPKPKTGHWIELGYVGNDNYDFECSECHHTDTQSKTVKVNYCWYCGAKMEGDKNGETTE